MAGDGSEARAAREGAVGMAAGGAATAAAESKGGGPARAASRWRSGAGRERRRGRGGLTGVDGERGRRGLLAAGGAGCRRRDRWRRIGAAPLDLTLWMDEVVGGDPPGLVGAANCGQWPWGSRRRGVGRGRPVAGRGSDVRSAEAEGVRGFQARGVSPLWQTTARAMVGISCGGLQTSN